MATQLRLRSAKVLLINLGAVGTEIVKNLVLGGINTIDLLDESKIKEEDYAAQFFLPNDASVIGETKLPLVIDKIKDLNIRVNLSIDTNSLNTYLENDHDYFKKFDLIIATELKKDDIYSLNNITRSLNIPLYVTGLHGMFGYILTDLIQHTAITEKDIGSQVRQANTKINRVKTISHVKTKLQESKETLTIVDDFVPMKDIFNSKEFPNQLNKRQLKRLSPAFPLIFSLFELNRPSDAEQIIDVKELRAKLLEICTSFNISETVINDEYLTLFCNQAFTEFAPVAAILGGALAQDVIQFLSKKDSPINNCLILDAVRSEMPIYLL